MAKFKLVFKGYCVDDVDAYIKETEEKIALLERTAAGKTPVIEDVLIKRELELTRKAKALDDTFKVFVSLIKSKLNADEVNEFLLIAQNIDKITKAVPENTFCLKKTDFDSTNYTSKEPVASNADNESIVVKDIAQTDLKQQEVDATDADYENLHQSNTAEENTFLTSNQETVNDAEDKNEQQNISHINKSEKEDSNINQPLIDLNEVEASPSQSLEELCKDLGFMD